MFEDITFRNKSAQGARVAKTSRQLVSKYAELKKYTEIYARSNGAMRKKLRRHKGKVLELLHYEMGKKLKPEETYEIWHDLEDVLNKNVSKMKNSRKSGKKKNGVESVDKENDSVISKVNTYLENREGEEGGQDREQDHRYEEYDIVMTNKLHQFMHNFDHSNNLSKSKFIIESNGLEVLPVNQATSNTSKDTQPKSIFNHHLKNLSMLLHLQMMKQNWAQAYKIFSILIRFPQVDLRSIWPLGIEILLQMSELHHHSNTWSLKVKKFFNYLASFYSISNVNATTNTRVNNRGNVAPVWRSGSKTLTPVYIIASLWNLFVLREYEQVLNKVNELILEPPFNMEGVLYFIAALCWVCNADGVVSEWKTRGEDESGRRGVLEELGKCERELSKNLKKCDELSFEFPKELVVSQMKSLYDAVNINKAAQESSASEMEEDEVGNDSDDVDWGAISSDSSDNDDEEEERHSASPVPAQPTQLDDMNDANYSDDEEEEVRESLKQVDRTADIIEINSETQRDHSNGSVKENPASQPLFYADTQRIGLPDTQRIDTLPDTQPIEFEEEDYENDIEMRDDGERNGHAFGSFDTRRNSLELYSTKSSSIEPDFKRNNTKSQSQQTMLDFDFDFDSDSN